MGCSPSWHAIMSHPGRSDTGRGIVGRTEVVAHGLAIIPTLCSISHDLCSFAHTHTSPHACMLLHSQEVIIFNHIADVCRISHALMTVHCMLTHHLRNHGVHNTVETKDGFAILTFSSWQLAKRALQVEMRFSNNSRALMRWFVKHA